MEYKIPGEWWQETQHLHLIGNCNPWLLGMSCHWPERQVLAGNVCGYQKQRCHCLGEWTWGDPGLLSLPIRWDSPCQLLEPKWALQAQSSHPNDMKEIRCRIQNAKSLRLQVWVPKSCLWYLAVFPGITTVASDCQEYSPAPCIAYFWVHDSGNGAQLLHIWNCTTLRASLVKTSVGGEKSACSWRFCSFTN